MISVIIPTYKNPEYLDLCLSSIINGQRNENEIIVVVDGYVEKSAEVLKKYKGIHTIEFEENRGIQSGMNIGVWNASNEKIFIINDDNVLPDGWDVRLEKNYDSNTILTVNQIEPTGPGMYNFPVFNCGLTPDVFDSEKFNMLETSLSKNSYTADGNLFPILLNKKWYVTVGGLDTFYDSPNWCDIDFFLKLQMIPGLTYARTHDVHLYHFGSVSTRKSGESEKFRQLEGHAMQQYHYKWGYIPNLQENAVRYNNSKLPYDGQLLRGVNL
jgi:glycosyltransferase involved in cell wall biosynthesis